MGTGISRMAAVATAVALLLSAARFAPAQKPWPIIFPEQRTIDVRDPAQIPYVPLPPSSAPPTVTHPDAKAEERHLSLDEAVRIALENARVIRVLTGISVGTSGRTIYDAAIDNNAIDIEQARFDPRVTVNNSWNRQETPGADFIDPFNPGLGSVITGLQSDDYRLDAAIEKENPLGGEWRLGINADRTFLEPGTFPLNPSAASALDLSYTQPLLQGFGRPANLAPIVLARIDTERSFFQLKDAVQEQVRGVIEAYWALVAARTNLWTRQRQVEQADFAFRLSDARFRIELDNGAEVAQARVTLANFRAQLITAQASVLQREAALRNILGLPPWDEARLIPTSEPSLERFQHDWFAIVDLAAQQRPDLIELKLILEADEQLLIQANNQALPRLDAVALYRWNGLEGETPAGNRIETGPGQFTDWTLGVNFSVPVFLRAERARLRQRELILARDRANLEQGLHAASHSLATTIRSLDQTYEQYRAFKEAREAARVNLDQQLAQFRNARVNFLSVLLAITDWGNAINEEATSVTQYNTLLAELERQSGTILETHGVRFYEERYGSIGPLGRLAQPVCYPESNPPSENYDRYPAGDQPAENIFNLEDPTRFRIQPQPRAREELPPP